MPLDEANIYKVQERDPERYNHLRKQLWIDTFPNIKEFVKDLQVFVKTEINTPYVLGLEAPYGMGKTYFSTRFCEHLKKDGMHAIYFSAWEDDYLEDPFLAFSKALKGYFKQSLDKDSSFFKKWGREELKAFKRVSKNFNKMLKSVTLSVGVAGVNAGILLDKDEKYENTLLEFKIEI